VTERLPVPAPPQPPAVREPGGPTLDERPPEPRRQPISVAFMPLALVAFVVLTFVAAAWTFLAATGA
jgi:hypothetical protein